MLSNPVMGLSKREREREMWLQEASSNAFLAMLLCNMACCSLCCTSAIRDSFRTIFCCRVQNAPFLRWQIELKCRRLAREWMPKAFFQPQHILFSLRAANNYEFIGVDDTIWRPRAVATFRTHPRCLWFLRCANKNKCCDRNPARSNGHGAANSIWYAKSNSWSVIRNNGHSI